MKVDDLMKHLEAVPYNAEAYLALRMPLGGNSVEIPVDFLAYRPHEEQEVFRRSGKVWIAGCRLAVRDLPYDLWPTRIQGYSLISSI
ncbi:MAG: hypothetical protein WDO70_08835 [Alphaproteobacteria bacterium]